MKVLSERIVPENDVDKMVLTSLVKQAIKLQGDQPWGWCDGPAGQLASWRLNIDHGYAPEYDWDENGFIRGVCLFLGVPEEDDCLGGSIIHRIKVQFYVSDQGAEVRWISPQTKEIGRHQLLWQVPYVEMPPRPGSLLSRSTKEGA